MIRNSVVSKLWLTIIAMVVVVLLFVGFLLQQFFDNYVYHQQMDELTGLAATVQTLAQKDEIRLQTTGTDPIVLKFPVSGIEVQVVPGGTYQQSPIFAGLTAAEKQQLASGVSVVRQTQVNGQNVMAVDVLVHNAQWSQPGVVQVTEQMSILNQPLARIRNIIIFATVLGILLTTGLAFVISKNLSRPLLQMNEAAEEMVRGNFHQRVGVVTGDEVGRLGRTLNALANELERTIAALSLEKEQLSSILSSLVDGVIAADLEGRVTLTNPTALRRLSLYHLLPTDSEWTPVLPQQLLSMMTSVIHTNETQTRYLTWQGRDIHTTMTPLYESDGATIRGVVCVFRDVTEERKLDRLRKDFIANVSHELRTPLSMMQGYTEALLDEFGDDPLSRHEITEIIHDETLRMKRLVNDLLNLAQLESGQFQLSRETMNLNEVLLRVGRKYQALAGERQLQLQTQVPNEPVRVLADADRLEQVFTNLIDNAIRHTQSGGAVQVTMEANREFAKIGVMDTGSGIPQEDIPYIFERFYKADKARTRGQSGGTGLGLAIARHIVLAHGGDIAVDSQEGQGTTFVITLPVDAISGEIMTEG